MKYSYRAALTSSTLSSAANTRLLFRDNNGSYWGDTTNNPIDTGCGHSNVLYGVYRTMDRYWNTEGYLQDTSKIKPG